MAAPRKPVRTIYDYIYLSDLVPGWTRGDEARALAEASHSLPDNAVIVEVGAFMGSGTVHAIDPFDGSGDALSVPIYREIVAAHDRPIREVYEAVIRRAKVQQWVVTHQARGEDVAASWATPIDMLFLDGDHSPKGARSAFEAWYPWLKPGGIIAVHNSSDGEYEPDHDGSRRLVVTEIVPPRFTDIELVTTTTFARKAALRQ